MQAIRSVGFLRGEQPKVKFPTELTDLTEGLRRAGRLCMKERFAENNPANLRIFCGD